MRRVHLIGMGGIGMSGLARMYLSRGIAVQGSDAKPSDILDELGRLGATVRIGHDAAHVEGADLVVYSSSIPAGHPEREAALRKGVRVIHRAEALAGLCEGKHTIAVTGTHGKTTTTAMIGTILRLAGRDPSIVVGGLVRAWGGNAWAGRGDDMVIEADESDASFLRYEPAIEVVTNIEREHMDHYGTLKNVEKAYENFVGRLREGGTWLGCAEDARVRELAARSRNRSTLYGFRKDADLRATALAEFPAGRRGIDFDAWRGVEFLGRVSLRVPGRHNALNALAAIGTALKLGIPFEAAAKAIGTYEGAGRRFDVKLETERYLVVDDYAHHPTEIKSTLEAARGAGRRRVVAAFQPHRYTRTRELLKNFARAFKDADRLIVTDVYAASEKPLEGVTGERVADEARAAGHPDATYAPRPRLVEAVAAAAREGDLVIFMGAGDVSQAAAEFAARMAGTPFADVRGTVKKAEPLSKHTTLKVGGPADWWVEPADAEDAAAALKACRREGLAARVVGAGSNLLASDAGFRGAILHLSGPYFKEIRLEDSFVVARAGAPNSTLIQFALERGLGGLEFLCGIPGHVGGAVAMNAGSHGQSVDALVAAVTVLEPDGALRRLERAEIPFSYRRSGLGNRVVVEAEFRLPKRARAESQALLDEYSAYRKATQDLQRPSAGCMFKNPSGGGCSAGKLIDEAGLKGAQIGHARVSEKHANFIVNLGGATSSDVRALLERVREVVREKAGVALETEVEIL